MLCLLYAPSGSSVELHETDFTGPPAYLGLRNSPHSHPLAALCSRKRTSHITAYSLHYCASFTPVPSMIAMKLKQGWKTRPDNQWRWGKYVRRAQGIAIIVTMWHCYFRHDQEHQHRARVILCTQPQVFGQVLEHYARALGYAGNDTITIAASPPWPTCFCSWISWVLAAVAKIAGSLPDLSGHLASLSQFLFLFIYWCHL